MTAARKPESRALADLVAKYDGRAPRYTSYPTAVQFTPQVDEAAYRRWLGELPAAEHVALYLHVPFCARLCWYCGCNTRAVNRHEPVSEYVQLLRREMALLQQALPGRLCAETIHLGGGTPNMLDGADLDSIFSGLAGMFDLTSVREVAAELDPAVLTRDWVTAAARHGLSRASLGVQNLDPVVQAAVNRREDFAQIAECAGWLRDAGVASLNIDLMYGLPRQTTASTLATLDAVLRLEPERIALFGYAHVPWMKAHQQLIDEQALPGPSERLDQSETAAKRLEAAGYRRIGLDHFALPTDELAVAAGEHRLHRNFQGYTTDASATLLGLGASAIGRLPQGFVQNISQELGWRRAIQAGQLPVARGVAFTPDDLFRGDIIERLMCDFEVDLAEVCARHGRPIRALDNARRQLGRFLADGLVRFTDERLEVVGTGRLVVRSVCAAFDAYLEPAAGRHSRTL